MVDLRVTGLEFFRLDWFGRYVQDQQIAGLRIRLLCQLVELILVPSDVGFIFMMRSAHDKLDDDGICASLTKIDPFGPSSWHARTQVMLTADTEFCIQNTIH